MKNILESKLKNDIDVIKDVYEMSKKSCSIMEYFSKSLFIRISLFGFILLIFAYILFLPYFINDKLIPVILHLLFIIINFTLLFLLNKEVNKNVKIFLKIKKK